MSPSDVWRALNDEFLYSLYYFLFWRALAQASLLPQEVGSDQLMERNVFPEGVRGSQPSPVFFSFGGKGCVFVV